MRYRLVTCQSRPTDLPAALALSLLALLLVALPAAAQEEEGERVISVGEDVSFDTGVTEVTVPVTVTGAQG